MRSVRVAILKPRKQVCIDQGGVVGLPFLPRFFSTLPALPRLVVSLGILIHVSRVQFGVGIFARGGRSEVKNRGDWGKLRWRGKMDASRVCNRGDGDALGMQGARRSHRPLRTTERANRNLKLQVDWTGPWFVP